MKKKWNEELHYDVNSKMAKMYVLSLGNIDENDYLAGKIIVTSCSKSDNRTC